MFNKHIKIKTERICSIAEVNKAQTYDIQNEEKSVYLNESNFYANGFLVHNSSKHAGGVIVSDKPIYNYIPVERVQGEIVSAYEESGQKSTLDDLSLVKYDVLGISVLETIKRTIEMIDEDLYLIEEDGIEKIVGESYIERNQIS